jgi:hypothetical protein
LTTTALEFGSNGLRQSEGKAFRKPSQIAGTNLRHWSDAGPKQTEGLKNSYRNAANADAV